MIAAKIHPAEIGFDFDGVIADTVEAFIRIACEQYAHCGIRPEDITRFFRGTVPGHGSGYRRINFSPDPA